MRGLGQAMGPLLAAGFAEAKPPKPPESLPAGPRVTLEHLVQEARQNNPDIR
jgi:outer membrane protein TolC